MKVMIKVIMYKKVEMTCDSRLNIYWLSKGMKYLIELIIKSNKEIPFTALLEQPDLAKESIDNVGTNLEIFDKELSRKRKALRNLHQRIPMTDYKTIADCMNEIRLLHRQLSKAKEYQDLGRIESINEEIGQIEEYLKCTYNPQTEKINYFPDQNRRGARSAQTAIHRALDKIRENDPELATALRESLYLGSISYFRPIPGLDIIVIDQTNIFPDAR